MAIIYERSLDENNILLLRNDLKYKKLSSYLHKYKKGKA